MDTMTLLGAEDVARAGRSMARAAESIECSVMNLDGLLQRHERAMEDLARRVEDALASATRACSPAESAAAAPSLSEVDTGALALDQASSKADFRGKIVLITGKPKSGKTRAIARLRQAGCLGPDVVVVDPIDDLFRIVQGTPNCPTDFLHPLAPYKAYAKTGATIVLVHATERDAGDLRGSYALVAVVDYWYECDNGQLIQRKARG